MKSLDVKKAPSSKQLLSSALEGVWENTVIGLHESHLDPLRGRQYRSRGSSQQKPFHRVMKPTKESKADKPHPLRLLLLLYRWYETYSWCCFFYYFIRFQEKKTPSPQESGPIQGDDRHLNLYLVLRGALEPSLLAVRFCRHARNEATCELLAHLEFKKWN